MTLSAAEPLTFATDDARRNYENALREYPAQAIVDLRVLRDNMRHLVEIAHSHGSDSHTGSNAEVMGVVKADAYGHGLIPAALAALAGGATWLGTAQASEAIKLRRAGIGEDRARIITWLYSSTNAPFAELIADNIDLGVGGIRSVKAISHAAQELGKPARVHIKVDSGFGRNGFTPESFDEALTEIKKCVDNGYIQLVGQWSHLAVADAPDDAESVASTQDQINSFEWFTSKMDAAGLHPQIRHLANTAATLIRPEIHYDLVRPGVGFYGYEPDVAMGTPQKWGLTPAMTLQAQLGTVKDLPAGHSISYGRTYITTQATSTADMPLGYADGIHRSASGFNEAGTQHRLHEGGPVRVMTKLGPELVRVSGRVCMDQCVLDLQGNAQELGISEGDTVALFGPGRGEEFAEPTADDWARAADTISYEIFTCLGVRVPRLYRHAYDVLNEEDIAKLDPTSLI